MSSVLPREEFPDSPGISPWPSTSVSETIRVPTAYYSNKPRKREVIRPLAIPVSFALAIAAMVLPTARAAETSDSIDTVVILGVTPLQGAAMQANQIAAPVQTATGDQIERSHALDLAAFLNREAGSVYVNDIQNNPLQPDVSFRGYTASPLLGTPQGLSVYLDGVRLNQPFGDVVSWDLIPRQAIARLTLIPGSNPVFGLNTLGGALALYTKDGYGSPGASLELNYGSSKRRRIEGELGGHADSGLYWYGTANKLKEDGWRDASPSDATQAFAKIGRRSSSSDIALGAAYADTHLTGNGLQEQQLLARDYASIYSKPDNTQNKTYLLNLVATRKLSESLSTSANAYYRNIRTHTLNGDVNDDSLGESLYQPTVAERNALAAAGYAGFPTSGETQANTPFPRWRCIANILLNSEPNEKCNGLYNRTATRQHDEGVTAQAVFGGRVGARDNHLTVGISAIRTGSAFTQSSQFGYLTPDRGVALAPGPGAFADGTQDSENAFDARVNLRGTTETRSVYFTDTLKWSTMAQLTLSGRYDDTRVESEDVLTPAGNPGSLSGSHRFQRFNPGAGLTLNPTGSLSAYLSYSQSSRAPSVIELGCADPDNPCKLPNAMAGDPPLDQVTTSTYEAGLRGVLLSAVSWNVGVFRSDNRDDIMFVADEQSGFGYFKNFGRTRRQGLELGAGSTFGPVTLTTHYTYLDATYRSAEVVGGAGNSTNDEGPGFEGNIGIKPGDHIPLIPRQIFKVALDWQIVRSLSLSADAISIGGSYSRGNENNAHQPDGTFYIGPGRTSGYAVVNFGAELKPSSTLKLVVQVNNVFDREYFTGSQLGSTAFDAAGNFVARPFAGPVVNGERPLLGSTFYAPGALRSYWVGVKYSFSASASD